ncbi:MAG TPA: hypothetical protein VGA36_08480 [Nitriliruptorales bacterium]
MRDNHGYGTDETRWTVRIDGGTGPWLGHPDTVGRLVEEFVTAR